MPFLRPAFLSTILLISLSASARPVRTTLWISGGLDGILYAGENAPGLLGVMQQRQEDPDPGYWLDVGGSRDLQLCGELPTELMPAVVVPDENLFRLMDLSQNAPGNVTWTLLNLGTLPQFPDARPAWPASARLQTPDGFPIRVVGLLADDAPWHIPLQRLQPLRVLDAKQSLSGAIPAWRKLGTELRILTLPERADAGDWSRSQPDFDILVLPAAAPAEVIALDQGRRWRVRPAPHGRAVIRVTVLWESVSRDIQHIDAEVMWVRKPDLEKRVWPDAIRERLRALNPAMSSADQVTPETVAETLLRKAEAQWLLLPDLDPRKVDAPTLRDAWKVAWFPQDQAWVTVNVDAALARAWSRQERAGFQWHSRDVPRSGPVTVLLPADLAARFFQAELKQPTTEILPWTSRDCLPFSRKD